jgi:hypothetical protein
MCQWQDSERAKSIRRDERRWSDFGRSRRVDTEPFEGENKLDSSIFKPLVALVIWSFVMWGWLYAARIPAIRKYKIALDPNRPKTEFDAQLPAKVRWKADNYNHLMEQPTLFYAVSLTLAFLGAGQGLNTGLAWLYVGLRIAHSLVQALVNVILLRFTIFMVASLVLLALTVRAALIVF